MATSHVSCVCESIRRRPTAAAAGVVVHAVGVVAAIAAAAVTVRRLSIRQHSLHEAGHFAITLTRSCALYCWLSATVVATPRTSVGVQLSGTKVRGLIPCGPAALSQRLGVGDEILSVDNTEVG